MILAIRLLGKRHFRLRVLVTIVGTYLVVLPLVLLFTCSIFGNN
ncbi:Uncharacterised protein [Vibrio cholerae]|nr:Uncharacterised protein [Vibrio cholerae]